MSTFVSELDGADIYVPEPLRDVIYRVAQESVANALRHAEIHIRIDRGRSYQRRDRGQRGKPGQAQTRRRTSGSWARQHARTGECGGGLD